MGSRTPVKQPQSLLIKKALPALTSPSTVYDSPTDINFMKWQNSSIRFSKSQPHLSSPVGLATIPPCRETLLAPQPQGPARLQLSHWGLVLIYSPWCLSGWEVVHNSRTQPLIEEMAKFKPNK